MNPKKVLMKKSFVLRLDDEMYKLLEKWAADEFRSVNGQLEYIINQSLINSGRKKNKTENKSTDKK
nr:Arc family DNA-binding protein [Epilithonimonas sp.]